MAQVNVTQRFLESSRGRILALLRCGPRTVEELANALSLTDNAVRAHLTTLERDRLVGPVGVRRGPGAGKPSTVYELAPGAEAVFSRAYAPALTAVLEELVERLPGSDAESLLKQAGRRLAASVRPGTGAGRRARLEAAVAVLNGLGGAAELEEGPDATIIRGCGCPLALTVARRPETCHAVEALLAEVIGGPVRQRCRHGERPACCFEVPSEA